MAKCFFTEMDFKTEDTSGNIHESKEVMFHDERSGFVGIASKQHKEAHPAEYQEFLALTGKKATQEDMKPVDGQESAEEKNAMIPTDKKAESDLSELASKEQKE